MDGLEEGLLIVYFENFSKFIFSNVIIPSCRRDTLSGRLTREDNLITI
jgi:hypothetical protein